MGGRGSGSGMSSNSAGGGTGILSSEIAGGKVYKTRSNGIATLGGNTSNADVMATINRGEFVHTGMDYYTLGVSVKLKKAPGLVVTFDREESILSPNSSINKTGKWRFHDVGFDPTSMKVTSRDLFFDTRKEAENAVRRKIANEYRDSEVYKRKNQGL